MKINIIAACDMNGVIGINGKLPFHIPEDLKRFKELTMGHAVIMGRKTHESIGKELKGRFNIVVTSNENYHLTGWYMFANNTLQRAIARANSFSNDIFIIGGEQLYREALPLADKVYLTLVNQETPIDDGDEVARFPIELIDKQFTSIGIPKATSEYCFFDLERKTNTHTKQPA